MEIIYSSTGTVFIEGQDLLIGADGNLTVEFAPVGEYDFSWIFETPDQGDYLSVNVTSGKVFVNFNGQWFPINGQIAVQPNQYPEPLKLRIDEPASFSLNPVDSYAQYPYDDAPTNPMARFTSLDELPFPVKLTRMPTENLGNITETFPEIKLSTGGSDRAASTLGTFANGDREFLKPLGTEGSATKFTDLSPGVYSFDWSMYSKDAENNDSLYAWNGKQLIKIGDRAGATQISSARWTKDWANTSIDVPYDFLYVIAMDANTTTGTSDFSLRNFHYSSELPYDPPIAIALNSMAWSVGDIKQDEKQLRVTTGTYDRAISTLSYQLTGDRDALDGYGTEGSLAMFEDLELGTYEITWQLYTAEDEPDKDAVYLWNGEQMQLLADRSLATTQVSSTRFVTNWTTTQIEVTNDRLGFIALDTGDGSGTTELRISKIEKVASAPPGDETLDTTDIAILPSSPVTYSGEVGGPDPGDLYQFETDDVTRAIANLDVQWGDANLELWKLDPSTGAEVELIASSNNPEYQSEDISLEIGSALYHFKVIPNGDEPMQYQLTLNAQAATPPPEQTNDITFLGAISSEGLHVVDEFIGSKGNWNDPEDNWTFRLTEAQTINLAIENTETLAGLQYQLYQLHFESDYPDFEEIDRGYVTGSGITQPLSLGAGNYMIKLTPNTGAYEFYDLHLTATSPTAPTTHDPIQGEPPYPYPENPSVDMGNDWLTAWNMGDESPWESDPGNGSQWTYGYEYRTYHLGHFAIAEKIGGETVGGGWDSSDRTKFTLTNNAYLNLYTDPNVITELVRFDASGNPSVVASVEYGSRIQTFLSAGQYGLSFFVEGDAVNFSASGYLSQFDPNYAD